MSTFTVNKGIQQPASGSFNNAWAAPVNADWEDIDNALGGSIVISVTGVAAGTYALTLTQYQPPIIQFSGTLSGALLYVLPAGVGGVWSVFNNTTGAFSVAFGITGGGFISLPQGFRSIIISDGTNVALADSALAIGAEAFATAADAVVLSTAEAFATAAASTAQSNAEAFSANASNLSSGTVPNGQLPNIGNMPGVTIAADPGGTPSGSPGQMFFYY